MGRCDRFDRVIERAGPPSTRAFVYPPEAK
jgi:hypothetical protein